MRLQMVLATKGARLPCEDRWPETGPASIGRPGLQPSASRGTTTQALLRPLDMASVNRFFAADGKSRGVVLPRPRSDAVEDICRELAYFQQELTTLAPE